MNHRREAILNHPALVPIAGNFDRKPRSLDRDVTTIGRARGTDLCLEANEISTLHCMIYRTADGYRIRDCNSRTGTRINGESFKNQALHDADIINLGPFSFEFRLPPQLFPKDGSKTDPAKIEHWKRSRGKLARQALRLRRQLREADHGASAREAELEQKAHQLKEKIKAYDHRLRDMEEAEQELTEEREKLASEHEGHRAHVQQMEGKIAQRLAQTEAEIHQRWQEFQLRCQADEARHQRAAAESIDTSEQTPALAALQLDLEAQRGKLVGLEECLTRQQQQLQSERQEFLTMKDQWVKDQTQSSVSLEEQQAALVQRETAVNAQKAELMRMMGSLKKMQEDLRKQAKGDLRGLHEENERLQHENAQLQAQFASQGTAGEIEAALEENNRLRARLHEFEQQATAPVAPEFDDLRTELDRLREELELKEAELAQFRHQPQARGAPTGGDQLKAENELLKKLLQEKERFVAEMAQKAQHQPKNENDLEKYETELNEYRRQLEVDRVKLNKEVEMLRERNKELDDAVREMEMEMSKERAELGRERMRLERVRDEIKGDMERMQREIAVRDSMAPVQKLRDEIAAKQAGAGKGEKTLNDRLRGFRNQLSDNPS